MRKQFDDQLGEVKSLLCGMCRTDAAAMRLTEKALSEGGAEIAEEIKECERASDEKEREIERLCMRIIVRWQPVAHDLALITSAMKMVTDLERITDQAADIAEITGRMKERGCIAPSALHEMMRVTVGMVEDCADALDTFDAAKARAVCREDDAVDALFEAVKAELARSAEGGSEAGECALDLLMIAKYLERIGDHAVNAAEWIIFSEGLGR
ncbi:MAG: phosphate signaling complex protein PhoU [Christensenellales bacterium]|nr:phosphate signaling complex protein PhoU [Christensenellales bacterium]